MHIPRRKNLDTTVSFELGRHCLPNSYHAKIFCKIPYSEIYHLARRIVLTFFYYIITLINCKNLPKQESVHTSRFCNMPYIFLWQISFYYCSIFINNRNFSHVSSCFFLFYNIFHRLCHIGC